MSMPENRKHWIEVLGLANALKNIRDFTRR